MREGNVNNFLFPSCDVPRRSPQVRRVRCSEEELEFDKEARVLNLSTTERPRPVGLTPGIIYSGLTRLEDAVTAGP